MVPHVLRHLLSTTRALRRYVRARSIVARELEASGMRELLARLERARRRAIPLDDVARATRIAERALGGGRLGADTCLYRALARYGALLAAGHAPRFVMGIDPHDIDRGHAWVELDGAPWLERVDVTSMQRTFEHGAPAPR